MKKLYTLLAAVIITASAFAQAPEKMSYQAVVRDASNALITSQTIGMQISILQGSITGSPVYVETQTPTTNINGLASIEIGSGTVISGTFNAIDWSNGPYFIKTETDPTGGTSYTITGTSQLMSVPYALHAKTAESITGTVNYTETDPVFGASIANGITALDTANWNNHIIDTDTQLDSTDIAILGFVAGAHTVDTDTQLDSTDIATLGFVAGAHTTDTKLDSTGVAGLGFVAGAHTVDTDTQLDSTDIANLDYVAGAHTTDTQLDSTDVANLGFITSFTEVDGSVTNEIQSLTVSQTGDTLMISAGNYVLVPGISLLNFPPAVGDFHAGGVVFWVDGSGGGLVCAVSDQSSGIRWYNGSYTTTSATGTAIGTGQANTTAIISNQGPTETTYAAGLAKAYTGDGYTDWFLPSRNELDEMYSNKAIINTTAIANSGSGFSSGDYWSSTEINGGNAWAQSFSSGSLYGANKANNTLDMRAVRAF